MPGETTEALLGPREILGSLEFAPSALRLAAYAIERGEAPDLSGIVAALEAAEAAIVGEGRTWARMWEFWNLEADAQGAVDAAKRAAMEAEPSLHDIAEIAYSVLAINWTLGTILERVEP